MAKLIYNNDGKGKEFSHSVEIELDAMAKFYIVGQGSTKEEAMSDFKKCLSDLLKQIDNEIEELELC